MKYLSILLACIVLIGCESDRFAPPVVTSQMTTARKGRQVDLANLREGRRLFAHRCIECHTLPNIWYYGREEWPGIVDSMAHRASLKPEEREAIVAFIIAARAQPDRTN